ncbi:MAG: hypothetical protein JO168_21870 [Solirubrobacterales bacterium]|nr:hypothetical protein [Solirubrobacterales bacterium]
MTDTSRGRDHVDTSPGRDHVDTSPGRDHVVTSPGPDHVDTSPGATTTMLPAESPASVPVAVWSRRIPSTLPAATLPRDTVNLRALTAKAANIPMRLMRGSSIAAERLSPRG